MAIEEIDPETGEIIPVSDASAEEAEMAALQAKMVALQKAASDKRASDEAAAAAAKASAAAAYVESENPNPTEEAVKPAKLSEQAKPAQRGAGKAAATAVAAAGASGGALAVAPDLQALMLQHAGRGLNFEARDLSIPRIVLLQDNSPQVKKQTAGYIAGAEAGMLMNSSDNALMVNALIVPIYYKRRFVGWKPRDEKGGGGGLVRPDVPESEYLDCEEVGIGKRAYRDVKHGLVEIVDTPEWYVLLSTDGTIFLPAAISMAGTKAKIATRMNTVILSQVMVLPNGEELVPAPYSNLFRLSSKREGEGSEAYFNFATSYEGRVSTAAVFMKAARYHAQFSSGELDAAPLTQD